MKFRLQGSVTIPKRPSSVGGLIGWARGVNRTLKELQDRKIVGMVEKRAKVGIVIPFNVTLFTVPADPPTNPPTYEVTVGWGYVCTRITGTSDAIGYSTPSNRLTGAALTKFPITAGQAVYIKIELNPSSVITATTVVVTYDNQSSLDPVPPTYAVAGTNGYHYYKLAVLDAAVLPSTIPTLKKWLTGSHLDHYKKFRNGVNGDMLYHDGTDWVTLAKPSSSGVFVLSHDGTVPSWLATEECDY
jgi:hypothetical protein